MPGSWHELSDKQLSNIYQLLVQDFNSDEVKTLCLLCCTGTKVIGKWLNNHTIKKGDTISEVTSKTLVIA